MPVPIVLSQTGLPHFPGASPWDSPFAGVFSWWAQTGLTSGTVSFFLPSIFSVYMLLTALNVLLKDLDLEKKYFNREKFFFDTFEIIDGIAKYKYHRMEHHFGDS